MNNITGVFEKYEGDVNHLVVYKQITGHLVYDIILDDNFSRK